MKKQQNVIDCQVIIEIVHGIKKIVIELIDRTFPQNQKQ